MEGANIFTLSINSLDWVCSLRHGRCYKLKTFHASSLIVKNRTKPLIRRFLSRTISGRASRILLLILSAGTVAAQDGYWINTSGGSWASAANWDSADGIAAGADSTAYFGFVREATVGASASFTLDGAQTVGNLVFTTQGGPASWSFNAGAGGSLTLDSTFGPSEVTVTSPSLQVVLDAMVAGAGGVEKDGAGTLVLAAQNTYTGQTLVKGGGLNVTGTVGVGGVNVANATLSGTGVIMGPVVIQSGGTLSLGNSGGPLTINNSLVLLPGSTTALTINGSSSIPAVQGLSSVTYGGTLLMNNLSGTFALGQTFSIFGSATVTGSFTSIQPPPGPGLTWRLDPATGELSVVLATSQPIISSVALSGSDLLLEITGGPPGAAAYIIASTDLSLPKTQWERIDTNAFDMSGNLTWTRAVNVSGTDQLYLMVSTVTPPN
jgi:autotransporter-associated beta strand protein